MLTCMVKKKNNNNDNKASGLSISMIQGNTTHLQIGRGTRMVREVGGGICLLLYSGSMVVLKTTPA